MTAPRFAPCKCAHTKADHQTEGFAPQCTAAGCTCLQYRPQVVAVRPTTSPIPATRLPAAVVPITPTTKDNDMPPTDPAPAAAATLEQLVAAGKRSDNKKITALAAKVETLGADLRARIAADAADAELRRKARDLEEQLAAIRAEMRGSAAAPADKPCPDCGKPFTNLGVHRARKHSAKAVSA